MLYIEQKSKNTYLASFNGKPKFIILDATIGKGNTTFAVTDMYYTTLHRTDDLDKAIEWVSNNMNRRIKRS